MAKQLSNINICEITLCKEGKNGLQFIAKAADGAPRFEVPISKTDPVKKIVVGVVYEPDKTDHDGDIASAQEIEKAAWSALKNHAVVNKNEHGSQPVGAFLAESYIVKANDPDEFLEAGWAAVIKIEDDALWSEIEKGEISAFSMGGVAQKSPANKTDGDDVEKAIQAETMVFADNFADALKVLQAIAGIMEGVTKQANADSAEMKKALSELPEQMGVLNEKIESGQKIIAKIAEATTDGRLSSPQPGNPGIDPSKY